MFVSAGMSSHFAFVVSLTARGSSSPAALSPPPPKMLVLVKEPLLWCERLFRKLLRGRGLCELVLNVFSETFTTRHKAW